WAFRLDGHGEGMTALHPNKLPPWAINVALSLLILALYPLDRFMQANLDDYYYLILVQIGLNVILATSLNLINGITGQFSLGHAGFMALGAYVTGSAMQHFNPTGVAGGFALLATLVVGGLVAAIAGLAIGIPTLRLRGDYL